MLNKQNTMSVRKLIKDRIKQHVLDGVANAKDDQASAVESLIRKDECEKILKAMRK